MYNCSKHASNELTSYGALYNYLPEIKEHSLLKPQKKGIPNAQNRVKLKAIQKGSKDKLTKA